MYCVYQACEIVLTSPQVLFWYGMCVKCSLIIFLYFFLLILTITMLMKTVNHEEVLHGFQYDDNTFPDMVAIPKNKQMKLGPTRTARKVSVT